MSKLEIYYNGDKSYFQGNSKYITHYSDNVQSVCDNLAISASANYDTYSGFITTQNKINTDIETTYKNISDDLTAMNNLISGGITVYEQQITSDYSEIYKNIDNYADKYKESLSDTIDKLFNNSTYGYSAINTAFTTYKSTMTTNIKDINTIINDDTTDIKTTGKYLESVYGTQNYWSDFEDAVSDTNIDCFKVYSQSGTNFTVNFYASQPVFYNITGKNKDSDWIAATNSGTVGDSNTGIYNKYLVNVTTENGFIYLRGQDSSPKSDNTTSMIFSNIKFGGDATDLVLKGKLSDLYDYQQKGYKVSGVIFKSTTSDNKIITSITKKETPGTFYNDYPETIGNGIGASTTTNFKGLFQNNPNIKNINALILPTISTSNNHVFGYMFYMCTALESIPAGFLPATNLPYGCYEFMFCNCTSLTILPDNLLPATTLAGSCYYGIFKDCTAIKSIPSGFLPALSMPADCYWRMFSGCISLTELPENLLPATKFSGNYSYEYMFSNCSGLTKLPKNLLFNCTNLMSYCYQYMFQYCSGLTELPENFLPATTLKQQCYKGMFSNCTAIKSIPSGFLPATTLANNCYEQMFSTCSSLESIPTDLLPATTLYTNCYYYMFSKCTKLVVNTASSSGYSKEFRIPYGSENISSVPTDALTNMFYSTAGTMNSTPSVNTTYYIKGTANVSLLISSESNTSFTFTNNSNANLQYSLNNMNFEKLEKGVAVTASSGKLYLRGSNNYGKDDDGNDKTAFNDSSKSISNPFVITSAKNDIKVSGKLLALIDFEKISELTTMPAYAFVNLFKQCYCLKDISELEFPTFTSKNCYDSMFYSCTYLEKIPEKLLATTLNNECYSQMFYGCSNSNFTSIPSEFLSSASSLITKCFYKMFANCSSLTSICNLPYTNLANYCYQSMFSGCSNLTANSIPSTLFSSVNIINWYTCESMFSGCSKLDVASLSSDFLPNIAYTGNYCYANMFSNTATTSIPSGFLHTYTTSNGCYQGMFAYTNITEVPENLLTATSIYSSSYKNMFQNCAKLEKIPANLLENVTSFGDNAVEQMFYGCTNLVVNTNSSDAYALEFIIPNATVGSNSFLNMFKNTKGTMNDTPSANTTYYIEGAVGNVLKFVSTSSSPITFTCNSDASDNLEYSFGGSKFTKVTKGTAITSSNGKLYLRGTAGNAKAIGSSSTPSSAYFNITQTSGYDIKVSGNILSLLNYSDPSSITSFAKGVFGYLFLNNKCISDISELVLPSFTSEECYYHMFDGCTNLNLIPSKFLPATNLSKDCYSYMFYNCTFTNTEVPGDLFANVNSAADSCFRYMFYDSNITTISANLLSNIKTLANSCYHGMFVNTKLSEIPSGLLPATALADYCYYQMFQNTKITSIPSELLPAITMKSNCYANMFKNCTSLVSIPRNLLEQAIDLAESCFQSMFEGCSSNTSYVKLAAESLPTKCYNSMFKNNTKLALNKSKTSVYNSAYALPSSLADDPDGGYKTEYDNEDAITDMFTGISSSGNFSGTPELNTIYYYHKDINSILIDGNGSSFTFNTTSTANLQYSEDGDSYVDYVVGDEISSGSKTNQLYIRGLNNTENGINGTFNITGANITISGNLWHLLDYTTNNTSNSIKTPNAFKDLFKGQSSITDVSELVLPTFTTAATNIYNGIFSGISINNYSKKLPNSCSEYCYANMFKNCTSLESIGTELFNYYYYTQLYTSCCESMFEGCTSLVNICYLKSTKLAENCYKAMFKGCKELKDTTDSSVLPESYLPATTLASGCYWSMFESCTGITKLPSNVFSLTSTEAPANCFMQMFYNCTNLETIDDTTSLLSSFTTLGDNCFNSMFANTKVSTPSEINATKLGVQCCKELYRNTKIALNSATDLYYINSYSIPGKYSSDQSNTIDPNNVGKDALLDMFTNTTGTFTGTPSINTIYYKKGAEDPKAILLNTPSKNTNFYIFNNAFPNLKYSFDGLTYKTLSTGANSDKSTTGKIYLRATGNSNYTDYSTDRKIIVFNKDGSGNTVADVVVQGDLINLVDYEAHSVTHLGTLLAYLFWNSSTENNSNSCWCISEIRDLVLPYNGPEDINSTNENYGTYNGMFCDCRGLKTINSPDLFKNFKDKELTPRIFRRMFQNCTGLTSIPNNFFDNITSASRYAFSEMFHNCIGLTSLPSTLFNNITTMDEYACYQMFSIDNNSDYYNHTKLTAIPKKLFGKTCTFTSGKGYQLSEMFSYCFKLETVSSSLLSNISFDSTNTACFQKMFYKCRALATISIDSTINSGCLLSNSVAKLPNYCCSYMFYNCYNLSSIPKELLNYTGTLGNNCYEYMFAINSSYTSNTTLTSINIDLLPSTKIADFCYSNMFAYQTKLTNICRLPATTAYNGCYSCMFYNTAVSDISKLFTDSNNNNIEITFTGASSTSTSYGSCSSMFESCTNIISVPAKFLYNITISGGSYIFYKMFYNCTKLTTISKNAISIKNVTSKSVGAFEYMFSCTTQIQSLADIGGWGDYSDSILNFPDYTLESESATIPNEDYIFYFSDDAIKNASYLPYLFAYTFFACYSLTRIPKNFTNLSAVSEYCYYYAFGYCANLTTLANNLLPAKTLAAHCYQEMFVSCYNIAKIPEGFLPATTLAEYCYAKMFAQGGSNNSIHTNTSGGYDGDVNATNRYYIPPNKDYIPNSLFDSITDTTLPAYCFLQMFSGNGSVTDIPTRLFSGLYIYDNTTGTYTSKVTLADKGCCQSMFEWCLNLESIQTDAVLPGANVGYGAYYRMFYNCSKLSTLSSEKLFSSTKAFTGTECCKEMFANCTSLSYPPTVPYWLSTLTTQCYYRMFANCTSLQGLPSKDGKEQIVSKDTVLAANCCEEMFKNCYNIESKLNSNLLPATTLAEYCYKSMFYNCYKIWFNTDPSDSNGMFALPAANLVKGCYNSMFYNCRKISNIDAIYYEKTYSIFSANSITTSNGSNDYSSGTGPCSYMFYGCTGINSIAEKFFENFTNACPGCFERMFEKCTSLNYYSGNNQTLPIIKIIPSFGIDACYRMFANCTGITKLPSNLFIDSSTKKINFSYDTYVFSSMFYGCSGLTSIDDDNLVPSDFACKKGIFKSMFKNCINLQSISINLLPTTTLAIDCYHEMFFNCIKLTNTCKLPATKVYESCYHAMFAHCKSNKTLTKFNISEYDSNSASSMKHMYCDNNIDIYSTKTDSCTSVYKIPYNSTEEDTGSVMPNNRADNMFQECNTDISDGTPILNRTYYIDEAYLVDSSNYNPSIYTFNNDEDVSGAIKFSSIQGIPFKIGLYSNDGIKDKDKVEYSFDNTTWKKFTDLDVVSNYYMTDYCPSTGTNRFKIYVRGKNKQTSYFYKSYNLGGSHSLDNGANTPAFKIISQKNVTAHTSLDNYNTSDNSDSSYNIADIAISGKIINLFDCENTSNYTVDNPLVCSCACAWMFYGQYNIADISKLDFSGIMATYCFYWMFGDCENLRELPSSCSYLPATVLAQACYKSMFQWCHEIKKIPSDWQFPVSDLTKSIYEAKNLDTSNADNIGCMSCFEGMFWYAEGLESIPEYLLSNITGKIDKYSCGAMFEHCIKLKNTCYIYASELEESSCCGMFKNCTSLTSFNSINCSTRAGTKCCQEMFYGCTSLTYIGSSNTIFSSNTILADYCCAQMFYGCTSLTSAPALPATTMSTSCYYQMFYGCTSLTSAPELPATTLAEYCYQEMFYNCSNLETPPNLSSVSGDTKIAPYQCYKLMFSGCRKLSDIPKFPEFTELKEKCFLKMFYGCIQIQIISSDNFKLSSNATLANECCNEMFSNCINLRSISSDALQSTKLASFCYYKMFYNCINLKEIPTNLLPATTLANYCYSYMFYRCTSLINSCDLPAKTLVNYCYNCMFGANGDNYTYTNACKNLVTMGKISATSLDGTSCMDEMFRGAGITKINMPNVVTSIGPKALSHTFADCYNLTAPGITINTTKELSSSDDIFFGTYYNCKSMKISETKTEEYKNAYVVTTGNTTPIALNHDSTKTTFKNTSGTYTGEIYTNTTYYYA